MIDEAESAHDPRDAVGAVAPDPSRCQSVDPQFSGPPYILPASSSLHGAGSTDFFGIPWLLYQDIAGNPRPGPDGTTDMGAYENWTDLRCLRIASRLTRMFTYRARQPPAAGR